MSKQIFVPTDKRTRSQVTLPDHILQVPQHSPFKNARNVTRNAESLATTFDAVEQEESEDELLLSPQKILKENADNPMLRAKRSASPTRAKGSSSEVETRESKRPRLDMDFDTGTTHRVAHKHNYSESDILPKGRATRKRNADTNSKKPCSTASDDLSHSRSPKQVAGKERARSVPVFPSTIQVQIPHLDLRNLPPSPMRPRPRSRSPSKEFEATIRVTAMPSAPLDRLEPIPDEDVTGLDITMAEPNPVDPSDNTEGQIDQEPQPPVAGPALETSAPLTKNQVPALELRLEIPSTLAIPQTTESMSPPSPLTPLPDAPQPSRFSLKGAARAKYLKKLEDEIAEGQTEDELIPQAAPEPQRPLKPATGQSRLPRPTQTGQLENFDTSSKTAVETRLTRSSDASKTTAPVPQAAKKNAFDVLMQNTQTLKGKGKQKATLLLTKPKGEPSSSKPSVSGSKSTTLPKQLPKFQDVEDMPRSSLKAKMRPKEKPLKSTLVPAQAPIEVAEEESRPQTPLRQSPGLTAVNTSHAQSPTTAKLTDAVPNAQDEAKIAEVTGPPLTHLDSATLSEQPEQPTPTQSNSPPKKQQKQPQPRARPVKAKLHVQKKTIVARPVVSRVTRSSSTKEKTPETTDVAPTAAASITTLLIKPQAVVESVESMATTSAGGISVDIPEVGEADIGLDGRLSDLSDLSDLASEPETDLPPGSPMRMSSPLPPATSQEHHEPDGLLKTPMKEGPASSPVKSSKRTPSRIPEHPHSSPSPTKIARSYTGNRRSIGGLPRRSPRRMGNGPSSLTTLSSALEKLRMPPPPRPNTSMGFNHDTDDDELPTPLTGVRDDSAIGRSSPGKAKASLSRSNILGPGLGTKFGKPLFPSKPGASNTKTGKLQAPTQQRLTNLFMSTGKNAAGPSKPHFNARGKPQLPQPNGVRIFGVGAGGLAARGRFAPKVSRKTSLPMVVGSPVKGGGATEHSPDISDPNDSGARNEPVAGPSNINQDTTTDGNPFSIPDTEDQIVVIGQATIKGKGKEKERKTDASRRASMAFNALSRSLSSLPTEGSPTLESMGPPITPREPGRPGLRSASNPYTNSLPSPADGQTALSQSRKAAGSSSTPQSAPKLSILKDCIIFVDVKTDTGEEAGDLFIEMLRNVGARLLTRVGQSCTHIVYKNGMASTVSRYRLLRDPKPFVVNITWVVDCVEQRTRVDESKYLVDLQHTNVAGSSKRRRSMLPKLISRQFDDDLPEGDRNDHHEGDMSVDGSNSSIVVDDDLPPLEKARRRKSMLAGPPA